MSIAADDIDSATLVYEDHQMSNVKQLQTVESAPITPMAMLERAVSTGAGLDTIEKLMNLQERWEKNEARKEFDAAISRAKAELPPVLRNKTGHNSKRYADFAAIAKAADSVLPSHGLSYRFRSHQDDRIHVTCIISHRSGHSEENTLSGPADTSGSKNAIQAIGSTLTYLQRYSLMQALGLAATDDDDGKAVAGDLITEKQATELIDLLEAHGADRAKFLRWAKVERVEDIAAAYYDSCVEAIKKAGK